MVLLGREPQALLDKAWGQQEQQEGGGEEGAWLVTGGLPVLPAPPWPRVPTFRLIQRTSRALANVLGSGPQSGSWAQSEAPQPGQG